MKQILLFLIVLNLGSLPAHGQNASTLPARTSMFLELLGNGGAYSLNIDHLISQHFSARLGFAIWAADDLWGAGKRTLVTFPVLGNFLFGKGSSKLETGAGFLLGSKSFKSSFGAAGDSSGPILNLTGVLGYRYQRSNGGFLFRIGMTPFYALSGGEDAYPQEGLFLSGGVSIGYTF